MSADTLSQTIAQALADPAKARAVAQALGIELPQADLPTQISGKFGAVEKDTGASFKVRVDFDGKAKGWVYIPHGYTEAQVKGMTVTVKLAKAKA